MRAREELACAREDLDRARSALAAACRAQDPERHFKALPESPEVIAAYDAVRDCEAKVAGLSGMVRSVA